ncbi:MAG: amidase [Desulfobacterales bacterium]|nr:amidase [Desulfobacterales bacterium]
MDDFYFLDAMGQAELVQNKEVQAIELVEAAIRRIELLNPKLNAVITPMFDLAIETACHKLPQSHLAGVPFLLKDLIATVGGIRQTEGSRFLKDYIAQHDSELVKRYKQAGLIIVGKTNTPEFGNTATVEPELFGPSYNPWNVNYTTGGSSGGSAAAVAVGMTPMAHGNDGGGSLRTPSSCCGVFGLKPTRGRNPLGPEYGDLFCGLIAEHALTRSVRDSAALLDLTSGAELGDPYIIQPPVRPFLEEVGADPGSLLIAFTTDSPDGKPVHTECKRAVDEAAKLCAELGHEMIEISPKFDVGKLGNAFTNLWTTCNAWQIDLWSYRTGKIPTPLEFEPLTWALQEFGRKNSAIDLLMAIKDIQQVSREIGCFFKKYDVWMTPTLPEPPVLLGHFDAPPDNPMEAFDKIGQYETFLELVNATGQPAMSIPLYWTPDNLPIGVQFIGRFGDEANLFRLAAQLEQARPWFNRHPPIL